MKSIAVSSYSFAQTPSLVEALERGFPGKTIRWNREKQVLDAPDLIEFLKGHSHAIVGRERIDAQTLSALPELKVIAKYGVGLDSLDLEALSKAGVRLGWSPGVNRLGVAELTLTFMLSGIRRMHEASHGLGRGNWKRPQGRQLSGKVVGIIGCGNIGREVVRLLQPFGCRVLAYDIRSEEREYKDLYRDFGVTPVALEELLKSSDIVSIHTPKNASTTRLLNAEKLSLLMPGSTVINTARGDLVDEAALLSALNSGRIGAAALDVFAEEPSPNRPLLDHPRVLCTPHIGGASEESILAMGMAAISGLSHAVDPLSLTRYQ